MGEGDVSTDKTMIGDMFEPWKWNWIEEKGSAASGGKG